MASHFKIVNPKFHGVNYDSWKEKMKTCFLCMGPRYWLMRKNENNIVEERKIEE